MAYTFSAPYDANDIDQGILAETVAAGELVARHTDGTIKLANAQVGGSNQVPCIGIAEISGVAGDKIGIVRKCVAMKGATGLTIGAPIYLDESADGKVTTTMPTTTSDWVQSLGHATSATEFCFDVGSGYGYLHA